jgi:hypothetical protein
VVWGVLGKALGSNLIPHSFWQAKGWFHTLLPEKFHVVILASICWEIWNMRNRVRQVPLEVSKCNHLLFHILAYLLAGLQKVATDKEKLLKDAHKLKQVAAMVYSRQDQNGGSSRQLAIVALT